MESDFSDHEPVVVPITDVIDLHSFRPRDIPAVVKEYLLEARKLGLMHVRIIHGRGIGFQRERVRDILGATEFVESYRDAPSEAGGSGATIVSLRI